VKIVKLKTQRSDLPKLPKKYTPVPETAPEDPARIVRRVPRPDPLAGVERQAAGMYRVIHGSIVVPYDPATFTRADGTIDDYKPKFERAIMGDEVYLGADDATRMLAASLVEPIDAKPSRVGKVWSPPKATRNLAAASMS
jgi:hypothetical protein